MDASLVRTLPLFQSVPRDRVEEIARVTDRVWVRPGTALARQGALAHEFFVLIEGEADVIRDGEVIATLGPGDFFGEIGLVGQPFRTATVVARTDAEVAVVTRQHFRPLLRRFPDLASTILSAGTRRVTRTLRGAEG